MWNKVLLINTNIWSNLLTDYFNIPPLGLEYIATYIKDLVIVDILDARNFRLNHKQVEKYINKYKPDLVGLNCNFTCGIGATLETAKIVKERYDKECTVVLGGWHPTLTPDECLKSPWVDAVVRGEGELTFRDIIKLERFNDVLGVSYKENGKIIHNKDRPLIKNLDELLFPYREYRKFKKFQMYNIPFDSIETSRGCPYSCDFCCIHVFYRRTWRARSPINIIKELYELKKLSNVEDILIVDDNFTINPIRVKKLCELLIKSNLNYHFICQTSVDFIVKNPDIVKLMAKAGFWLFFIGIESITEKGLQIVNKNSSVDKIYKAVKILRDYNITTIGNVIIGADLNETKQDIIRNIKNLRKLKVDFLTYSVLTPLPQTKLFEKLDKENLIISKDWNKYNLETPVINTYKLSANELKELLRIANLDAMFHIPYKDLYNKVKNSRGLPFIIKTGIRASFDAIKMFTKGFILRNYLNNSNLLKI